MAAKRSLAARCKRLGRALAWPRLGKVLNTGTTNLGGGDAIQPITPTPPVTDDWFKEER